MPRPLSVSKYNKPSPRKTPPSRAVCCRASPLKLLLLLLLTSAAVLLLAWRSVFFSPPQLRSAGAAMGAAAAAAPTPAPAPAARAAAVAPAASASLLGGLLGGFFGGGAPAEKGAPAAASGGAPSGGTPSGDAPDGALLGSLPGESFTLREWSRNDTERGERLCKGSACSAVRFLIAGISDDLVAREVADHTIKYLERLEGRVQEMFSAILVSADGCEGALYAGATPWCRRAGGGPPPLVVDVGSNAGFYTLFAAALGARVLSLDAQPHCAEFVRLGALASGFGDRVRVVGAFAAAEDAPIFASVPVRSGCWGTFPVVSEPALARSLAEWGRLPGGSAQVPVPGVALARLLRAAAAEAPAGEGVLLLKMDAEGAEAALIEHLEAEGVLSEHLVKNFIIEVNKMAVPRSFPESGCARDVVTCFAALFARFQRAGYRVSVHEPFNSVPIENVTAFAAEGWRWADFWFWLPR
jgi:FkbM family methyltransferase